MIGFTAKKLNLPVVFVAVSVFVLQSCVQPPVERRQEPVPETPVTAPAVDEPAAAVPVQPAGEQLTAPLMYGVLLGEIAGQRGRLDVSGASYLRAAEQSNDPRIAERALKILVYAKQPQLALEASRRWVELALDNLEARQTLAVLELRHKNSAEALAQFEYLLQHGEDDDPYASLLALLAREPDTAEALGIMQELAALRPQDPDAHFAYARLAVHAESWTLAEQEVARTLELKPDWPEALILQAQINFKQGRSEQARNDLAAAVARNPDNTELRTAYARLLVDMDAYAAARAEYRRLLKVAPNDGQIVYSLALLSLESGELKESQALFRKLVKLDYHAEQSYYYLGAITEEQGEPQRALEWYGKVDPDAEHWVEVQIRIARLEALGGDVKAGRERLRKVRLAHPAETQRLFLVEGEILSEIDWDEEAYTLYSDYLELQPDDTEVLYARALVAERLNRLQQSENDFLRILAIEPDDARSLNALGYTLADRTDRYDEALGYIEKALAQTPDDPAVNDSMGWVLYRLGRYAEARKFLQRAYDMTPDGEIAAHLGEAMWAMGDQKAARALWSKARKRSPGDPVLEETVRRYLR